MQLVLASDGDLTVLISNYGSHYGTSNKVIYLCKLK